MAVAALGEQMEVEIAQLWREGVGIACNAFVPAVGARDQAVVLGQVLPGAAPLEHVAVLQAGHRHPALGNAKLGGTWHEGAHHDLVTLYMAAQNREWIVMACFADALEFCFEIPVVHAGFLFSSLQ